jgi:hypothetical protein
MKFSKEKTTQFDQNAQNVSGSRINQCLKHISYVVPTCMHIVGGLY